MSLRYIHIQLPPNQIKEGRTNTLVDDDYQTGDRVSGPDQQRPRQLLLLLGGRISVDARAVL